MKHKVLYGFFVAASLLFSNYINAQAPTSNNIPRLKYQQNKELEEELGYTHAVKAGNMLYISGTVSTGDWVTQLNNIMDDIKGTLGKYGATFQNVVKQTVYTTSMDSLMANKVTIKSYYGGSYPASTWVEVKALLLPQYKVEIEIVAMLPDKN